MATIRDVARESGVSVATVSYVLNNGPRPVRDQTRERVRDAIRRLDYHPNAMARGLVRRRMQTLGVQFGQVESSVITNPYAASVLQGIFSAAAERDYSVLIFPKTWRDADHSLAPFRDCKTDGVLLIAPLDDSDMVSAIAALGLPTVIVSSNSGERYGIPCIDVDNRTGGFLAGAHLTALGHTRIAHIGGPSSHGSSYGRRTGFCEALQEQGVPVRNDYLRQCEYNSQRGYTAAGELLSLPEPPTAIFAGNDNIALGTLRAARERGLRVPEDLSLVGFDDVAVAQIASPPLTTVRQPLTELGSEATHCLLDRLDGSEGAGCGGADKTVLLPPLTRYKEPTLIVRGSTAAPPPLPTR